MSEDLQERRHGASVVSWKQHVGTLLALMTFFGTIHVWAVKTIAQGLVQAHNDNPQSHLNHQQIAENSRRFEKINDEFKGTTAAVARLELKLEVMNTTLTDLNDRVKRMDTTPRGFGGR